MEGKITQLNGARLLNGKMLGYYFCSEHGRVSHPVSKMRAETIKNSVEEFETNKEGDQIKPGRIQTIKNKIKKIKETKVPKELKSDLGYDLQRKIFFSVWDAGVLFLTGFLVSRFGASLAPTGWLFILFGILAVIMEILSPTSKIEKKVHNEG
jgi:hypothetical protein